MKRLDVPDSTFPLDHLMGAPLNKSFFINVVGVSGWGNSSFWKVGLRGWAPFTFCHHRSLSLNFCWLCLHFWLGCRQLCYEDRLLLPVIEHRHLLRLLHPIPLIVVSGVDVEPMILLAFTPLDPFLWRPIQPFLRLRVQRVFKEL